MGPGDFSIELTEKALEHLGFWAKSGQISVFRKIEKLIDAIKENPTEGLGKPELLKHNLAGSYSRRINREHRIVYRIDGNTIYILSVKGHY